MSGGVGPTYGDIALPEEQKVVHGDPKTARNNSTVARRRSGSFLSFRQLNTLAVIIVLSASSMVSAQDFGFVIFSVAYMYFISAVAFSYVSHEADASAFDPRSKIRFVYALLGAVVGLFLPIAYIFEGIFEGDQEGIKAAAPHVFLLASQDFVEGLARSEKFSTPIRVFVPVFYNSRRIFTIVDWLRNEVSKMDGYVGSARRLRVGIALAAINLAFWSLNLFGFLLPVLLPRAFSSYYCSAHRSKDQRKNR